ncbi:MAG: hypothetical protein EHM58_18445 [Ignavibacteriae bacterium]|nr:MAG: hypothetical protein EHM58_18445 [Ignavibacteriota bacterium]
MCKKIHITIALLAVTLFINISFAQDKGGWNIYTSFKEVKDLSIKGTKVWVATSGGLFTFDYNSPGNTIAKYTTMEGLRSNDLTSVLIDNSGNVWSGSIDGAITLLNSSSGIWKTNSDILSSTEPSKSINNIFQYGDFVYMATEFSVIKMKISSFEIVDQPYIYLGPQMPIKTPVYQAVVRNDTIWTATKNGIAYANINNYLPIQSSWENFTVSNSVLTTNWINTVAYFNNQVYFGTDSGMVYYQNGTLHPYTPLYNGNPLKVPVKEMSVSNNSMFIATYKGSDIIFKVEASNVNSAEVAFQGPFINRVKANDAGELFIGTLNKGVNYYKNGTSNFIWPNSPFSNLMYYSSVDRYGRVWAVTGSTGDWFNYSGIYRYDGTSWKNFTVEEYPILYYGCCGWLLTYPSRFTDDVWVSGFGNGLLKIQGDNIVAHYDQRNSVLVGLGNDSTFVLCEGMDEDENGKLWVLNSRCEKPIVNFTDGVAYPVPVGNSYTTHLRFLVIDRYGTKWMTMHNTQSSQTGVMYFNENANVGGLLNYAQLGADITGVAGITMDRNGEIWIGTNNGVAIILDPYQVIQNPNQPPATYKMRIIENGISTPLTEDVRAIKEDALNRKWLGTGSNGVLYVSQDGSTLLGQYNVTNSPLPDNEINNISIDNKSGVVYFSTKNGLASFKTIAIEALEGCDNISVAPNPYVLPNDNLLRIDGLVAGSSVKILTLSGTLIKEFETPGGRITTWDGKDMNGSYVSSGIYIVVGFNEDASQVCTGKVAVVRK